MRVCKTRDPRQPWEETVKILSLRTFSILALLLFLLGGVTACSNKPMNDQHSQPQDNSGGMGSGGGMGGGGGGY
jgi:hypothetical protein